MKRLWIVIFIIICSCGTGRSQERSTDVDALVSSNPPTTGEWEEELPASWSGEENKRVWDAYRKLVAKGKEAVPLLVANLDRKEFSTCMATSVPYTPMSVGDMCRMAIKEMFDPIGIMYKSRENAAGETLMGYSYFDLTFQTKRDAEKWWKQNQHKTVKEIKQMIRDWYIEREASFGFENDQEKKNILGEIDRRFNRDQKQNHNGNQNPNGNEFPR